jgi:hypothetical protein
MTKTEGKLREIIYNAADKYTGWWQAAEIVHQVMLKIKKSRTLKKLLEAQ